MTCKIDSNPLESGGGVRKGTGAVAINKKHVLVVDDDSELLQLVDVLLSRIGVDCTMAENAAIALHYLRTAQRPDVLILDLMLPDVSGLEFLRQIRTKPSFDDMPILILSALIEPDRIRSALDAGADRYLTKPYIANNLVTVVQDILRTGRRRK